MGKQGYLTIERGLRALADGGTPYSDLDVVWAPPTMGILGAAIPRNARLAMQYGRLVNRSGGAVIAAFGARLDRSRWVAGLVDDEVFTDDTDDAQDSGDDDFPIEIAGDNDTGFFVAAYDEFNCIALRLTTAANGAGAARVIQVPTGTSSWTTLTNPIIDAPQGSAAAQVHLILWSTPPNQVRLAAGHLDAASQHLVGRHAARILSTTAPATTAGIAGSLSVIQAKEINISVADDAAYEINFGDGEMTFECGADAIVGIMSSVAAIQNPCLIKVRQIG